MEELKNKYQVSSALGKTWVEQEQLILLFDGLDEVQAQHQNACVRALNQFIEAHGTTKIAVCSRVKDYEALSEHLKLRSAICIQPLTSEQVDQYLDEGGDKLTGLKTLLQHNHELEEFARKHLILSIMTLTYQGCSSAEFLNQPGSKEKSYQSLFEKYIERILQRRGTTQRYLPRQTKRWLIWLAKCMNRASQKVFLIEQLQPIWLQNRTQQILYRWVSFLIVGLIYGPIVGLIYGLNAAWNDGLVCVLMVGLMVGLIVGWGKADIETVETLSWSWQRAKKGFPKGLIVGLIVGLIGSAIQNKINPNQGIRRSLRNAVFFPIIILGLIFGPIFGLNGGLSDGLIGGVSAGLIGGGKACVQHFSLRLILYLQGHIPWNYARFLNYATDRLFMEKVGGGYILFNGC